MSNDTLDNATCEIVSPDNVLRNPFFQSAVYLMYIIIFFVALIGNGFVCCIVLSSSRMRTVTNYFIMNLAVGDILIAVLCVPFTFVPILKQYWPFGSFLCAMVGYAQAVSVFVSAYTLVAISIDKYIIIMWPLKPRISKNFAAYVIILVWIIAGITVLPSGLLTKLVQPSYNWTNETNIYIECDMYVCQEDWEGSYIGPEYYELYTKILMILQYVVPSIVLLFTYSSIAVVIWCHRIPGEAENSRDRRIARSKAKMIKMMVTVVFVYSLCWLPFNILLIFQDSISPTVLKFVYFPLHGLAMSHACYNPIIYCYMNSRFRDGLFIVLRSIPCCRKYLAQRTSSSAYPRTACLISGVEGTESSVLHRNNTCTTYISMKRKNCTRLSSTCTHQLPVRSASMMRTTGNANGTRRMRYQQGILDEQI
ncbi:RYamide receptor isoform X2 [Aethina tumida]|uniref:RYamide receptor isoform X2 n=1 Tax=Aethina tumida TaxID=116153 RepID=UPI00214976F5|nr:RYamide receptor isoform X2 [Aethina tumida]